ncbi:gliding motility-associated C-terminal domain-containing protein [candidate division KSB1 bacterium]|nr:gliding motility-associated C-terminal domain-containing protein [candidate division KSB1 bacterium]
MIHFQMAEPGKVRLDLYNATGQTVCTLIESYYTEGSHSVAWNGRDANDQPMPSGMYFYQLQVEDPSGSQSLSKRMLLVK